jgi:hypothetical protein
MPAEAFGALVWPADLDPRGGRHVRPGLPAVVDATNGRSGIVVTVRPRVATGPVAYNCRSSLRK